MGERGPDGGVSRRAFWFGGGKEFQSHPARYAPLPDGIATQCVAVRSPPVWAIWRDAGGGAIYAYRSGCLSNAVISTHPRAEFQRESADGRRMNPPTHEAAMHSFSRFREIRHKSSDRLRPNVIHTFSLSDFSGYAPWRPENAE